MFGGKKRRQPATGTLIGAESRIQGDIEFKGGLHIDGYVRGNVISLDEERSMLSISERGCVEGVVAAPHVRLNGTVKGDVKATERVELGPRAKVIGNVQYKLIEMAVGAEVNGKLIHESERRGESVAELDETGPVGSVNLVGE
ncbi:MAG TPA: polymer-forming cytoskeletal protein [Gammaproteobacteria bacterium]